MHCHARLTAEMVNLPEEFKQTTGYCSKLGASRDEETPFIGKPSGKQMHGRPLSEARQ